MSYSSCLTRISQIDSILAQYDPNWLSALSWSRGGSSSSFADTLATESDATTKPNVLRSATTVLPESLRVTSSTTLLAPDYANQGGMVQESAIEALKRFDSVADQIPYAAQVKAAAVANGIDPFLLASLCWTESSFDPKATSWCGAQGLTQLMPDTGREMGVTDAYDVAQNLNGGAKYLSLQMKEFGRVDWALAAYNQGPGAVAAAGGVPTGTWSYVNNILGTWTEYQQATR
jgi:soluble lytic murein transglycosylase-like protein